MNEYINDFVATNKEDNMKDVEKGNLVYNITNDIFVIIISDQEGNEVELAQINPQEYINKKQFKYLAEQLVKWVDYKLNNKEEKIVTSLKDIQKDQP